MMELAASPRFRYFHLLVSPDTSIVVPRIITPHVAQERVVSLAVRHQLRAQQEARQWRGRASTNIALPLPRLSAACGIFTEPIFFLATTVWSYKEVFLQGESSLSKVKNVW